MPRAFSSGALSIESEAPELHLRIILRQRLGDGRRQRRLPVVDVPDRSHVHACGLLRSEFLFRHALRLPSDVRGK